MDKMLKLTGMLALAVLTAVLTGCRTREAGRTHAHRANARRPNPVRHHQLPPPPAPAPRPDPSR